MTILFFRLLLLVSLILCITESTGKYMQCPSCSVTLNGISYTCPNCDFGTINYPSCTCANGTPCKTCETPLKYNPDCDTCSTNIDGISYTCPKCDINIINNKCICGDGSSCKTCSNDLMIADSTSCIWYNRHYDFSPLGKYGVDFCCYNITSNAFYVESSFYSTDDDAYDVSIGVSSQDFTCPVDFTPYYSNSYKGNNQQSVPYESGNVGLESYSVVFQFNCGNLIENCHLVIEKMVISST